jgi:hypothetical protein
MNRLVALVMVLVAGCTFQPGASPGSAAPDAAGGNPGADGAGGGGGDGAVANVACSITDPAMRLCIDFTEPMSSSTIRDLSASHNDATMTSVTATTRGVAPAAELVAGSQLLIAESPTLDIVGTLSFEMWINPTAVPTSRVYAFDNESQYALTIESGGNVMCSIGGTGGDTVTSSAAVSAAMWSHIACTYDVNVPNNNLVLYVDGAIAGCSNTNNPIPTNGTAGVAIGAQHTGTFKNQLVGGVDDVHVYAKVLSAGDVCAHAGNSSCAATCPSGGG